MAGYDWGVYPLDAIRPPTPMSDIDLLSDPPRNHDYLAVPRDVYEQAPAEVMQIFERLGRAGQVELRQLDNTYHIALGRLRAGHLVVLDNWWRLMQQKQKNISLGPANIHSQAATGAPVFAPHAFKPAPKTEPLRLMSDPPAPIIEL